MHKKAFAIYLILISLLCLGCVNAQDNDGAYYELDENQEISDNIDSQTSSEDSEMDSSSVPEEVSANASSNKSDSQAYLVLDNDANLENIYVGDLVDWIISVVNEGPDTAENVKVYDQLPDGLEYVKHVTTKGTFDSETGIWNIGNLSVSEGEVFLTITTKALTAGEKINKATLTTDSINLNNETYEEEEIDVFEHESYQAKSAYTLHPTGNPIPLILLSLMGIIISSKRKN